MMGKGLFLLLSLLLHCEISAKQEALPDQLQQGDEAFLSGELEHALSLYEAVLEKSPQNRRALVMAGYIHYLGMYFDEAEQHLTSVLEQYPEDGDALRFLGNIALQRIRPFEARSYYLRAAAATLGPEAKQEIAQNLRMAEERIARAVRLSGHYERSMWILGIVAAVGCIFLFILLWLSRSRGPANK